MEPKKISKALLGRLPGYLNYLKSLPEDSNVNISATTLAKALGLGDVQVRKDLAVVSGGGRRKTGHLRENLIRDIEDFLDYNNVTDAILIGAGKLGRALLDYNGFSVFGLDVLAGFDINPQDSNTECGTPIYPMEELESYCASHNISVGIITTPSSCAQEICDRLISNGIQAIWNFAPVHLNVPENIAIQNENLAVSLIALRMRLKYQFSDSDEE